MYDIDSTIARLCNNIPWQPFDTNDDSISKIKNTIRYRKNKNLKEIEDTFYSPPIFNSYKNAIECLINHDIGFKTFLDSQILTKEERVNLLKTDEGIEEVKKNFNSVLTLIDDILESIEYYIFDNTTFMIPVKSLVMSYSRALYIIKELDKYYAPYNAKLINPLVVWLVKDLPGDIAAIEDIIKFETQNVVMKDVVWRADNYDKLDIDPPEPYAPISDFSSNGLINYKNNEYRIMPHVPSNLPELRLAEGKYLLRLFDGTITASDHAYYFPENSKDISYTDDPLYNVDEILLNNPFLYAVGYNWLYLRYENLIVNGKLYQSKYDWCPDKLKTDNKSKIISAINICKPDHKRLEELSKIQEEINDCKKNIIWYNSTILAGSNVYTIPHNLNTFHIMAFIVNKSNYTEVHPIINRLDENNIQLIFEEELLNDCLVYILAPTEANIENNTTTQLYNIVGTGYINQYIINHNFNTRAVFCEIYNRNTGEIVNNYTIRRLLDSICIKFDENLLINDNLRINIYAYTPNIVKLRDPVDMLYTNNHYTVTDENKIFIMKHNFYNNNFLLRVYSNNELRDVYPKIKILNKREFELDFTGLNNGQYWILMIGSINRQINGLAIPLNNLVTYSNTITGDGKTKIFNIQHNLGTLDTFEQVFDVENIAKTIQLTDTKTLRSTRTRSVIRAAIDHIDENNSRIIFKSAPANGKKYTISLFGPLTENSSFIPSIYYNTHAKSFILVSTNSKESKSNIFPEYDQESYVFPQYNDKTTDYIIQHNFNTESIVAQVYDQHGLKIDCIIETIDNNNICISLSNKIEEGEIYKVNIISIPNSLSKKTAYNQYIKFNYINTFIANIPADCISNTFSIMHNMKTETVLVNVFNRITGESIETYVAINNDNCVTVAFKNILGSRNHIFDGGYANTIIYDSILDGGNAFTQGQPITYNNIAKTIDDNYFVVIIGCKNSDHMINNDERDEISDILTPLPHYYHEFKVLSDYNKSIHITYDNDYFDSSREFIHDQIRKHKRYNIQKSDIPEIRERIDIIHYIKNNDYDINTLDTETIGFNANDMTTNDFYGGAEVVGDVKAPMLDLYKNTLLYPNLLID